MSRATHPPSHPRGRSHPMVTAMASHLLFNPGPDAQIVDEPGHQADPGHFVGDPNDSVTADLLRSERLLDQGPAPAKRGT